MHFQRLWVGAFAVPRCGHLVTHTPAAAREIDAAVGVLCLPEKDGAMLIAPLIRGVGPMFLKGNFTDKYLSMSWALVHLINCHLARTIDRPDR